MQWWARESTRQLVSIPLLVVVALTLPGHTIVKVLACWDVYAVVYLSLTWLAFRRLSPERTREFITAAREKRLAHRLRLVSPPHQLSQLAAVMAMITTIVALPQARSLDAPEGLVLAVSVLAVLTAWMTIQAGFALEYLNLHTGHGGLDFPGDDEPGVHDFLYFTVAVGTTFGTTDVTVTSSRMRRLVATHGALAFVFNTLVLAVAVSFLGTYFGR